MDLDGLTWQRGGYRVSDLDRLYTGNDIRAMLVFEKFCDTVLDPLQVRGLGFCCSVAHAEFMARFFTEHNVPSTALSAASTDAERNSVQQRLKDRSINLIFVVDLYNEGVDIPEVDTVLFLRPTESLTVFLQQLGRGLRLHDDKECLTVLDFIGNQRKEFRFASRFRALSVKPAAKLDQEIESEFPHLPSVCVIKLERVAQQRVFLQNVRESIRLSRPRMLTSLRDLRNYLGHIPSLDEAVDYLDTSIDQLFKRGLWSRILFDAGIVGQFDAPDEQQLAKGLSRLSHLNCPAQIALLKSYLQNPSTPLSNSERLLVEMLHVSLWGMQYASMSYEQALARLRLNPSALSELKALLDYCLKHAPLVGEKDEPRTCPLTIHAAYTRTKPWLPWDTGVLRVDRAIAKVCCI